MTSNPSLLAGEDPVALLELARRAPPPEVVAEADFVSPTGRDEKCLPVPGRGVIHPAHVGWVAEALGRSREWVTETLGADGLGAVLKALGEASPDATASLRRRGIDPQDLVWHWLPVPAGLTRPNVVPFAGANPVLSPENAAWQALFRSAQAVQKLIEFDAPPLIVDNRCDQLQRSFESLLFTLRGQVNFRPERSLHAESPLPEAVVVAPARSQSWVEEPLRPLQVGLCENVALVRYPGGLARVDLRSGRFSTHPFCGASLVTMAGGQAVFCDGARLNVFDLSVDDFVLHANQLPRRVVLGACCGVDILDTASRCVATMPGPLASSGYDVATSACGRWGWVELGPQVDDIGVFSVEDLARVFQPWPHPSVGRPEAEDPGEGHDGTVRALARRPDGAFCLLYGPHVLKAEAAHALPTTPSAAGFEASAQRLATVDAEHLSVFELSESGVPTLQTRWSLSAIRPHLSLDGFDLSGTGLEAGAVLGAVGTVAALGALDVEQLEARVFFDADPTPGALSRLLRAARQTPLPTALTRVS